MVLVKMITEFLFLSAERNTSLLNKEINTGIHTLNELKICIKSSLINIKSIYIKEDSEGDPEKCSVTENIHSLQDEPLEEDKSQGEEEFHFNDFYKLAEYLHSYADANLKGFGTSVHILWCVKSYIPCPSEVIEFYGALERMVGWHNATLNIIPSSCDAIEEWLSSLPLQIACSSSEVMKEVFSTVWRGSLLFAVEGKVNPASYPEIVLTSPNKNASVFTLIGIKECNEMLYVLPTAEVFSEVDLSSIPWPFIQKGSHCSLSPSPYLGKEEREELENLLTSLSSTHGAGTLLRIRYSTQPPCLTGMQDLSTSTWKRTVAEGNFDAAPSLVFEGCHDVMVFLVLPKTVSKKHIDCVILQDPTLYGEDIVKMVLQEQLSCQVFDSDQRTKVISLLKDTTEFNHFHTAVFNQIFTDLPDVISQLLEVKGQRLDKLWSSTKLQIERCTSNVLMDILASLSQSTCEVLKPKNIALAEISVPKECWSEYKALEEKERRKSNAIIRCTSGDFLHGLPPPVIPRKVKETDVTELLRCFEQRKVMMIIQTDSRINIDGRKRRLDLKSMSWMDAIHCKYHGIYYNNSEQQEKSELRWNRVREQNIRFETASSCTTFQIQDSLLSHPTRSKVSSTQAGRKLELPPTKSGRRVGMDADRSSVVSSVRSSRYSEHRISGTRIPAHKIASKPLRRSPRKRPRDEAIAALKPSDLFKGKVKSKSPKRKTAITPQRKNPTPADLSEVHKQKLRNVVLSALDGEGVTMKDPIFKMCFKKLFTVCRPFALDVIGFGETKKNFETIAMSHVKQVVQFEKKKNTKNK